MKEMSSNPQKLKKQLFARRMILDLFQKSKTLHFNILSITWDSFGSDTDSVDSTNTKIITRNNGRGVINDEWEMLETIASNALL
jgi:hypothetical protein